MYIKRKISGLMLSSLLLTTGLALAEEQQNKPTTIEKLRDIGLSGAALIATEYFILQGAKSPYFYPAFCAALLVAPTAGLCVWKAETNQTWKDIFQNKKSDLAEYFACSALIQLIGNFCWSGTNLKLGYDLSSLAVSSLRPIISTFLCSAALAEDILKRP